MTDIRRYRQERINFNAFIVSLKFAYTELHIGITNPAGPAVLRAPKLYHAQNMSHLAEMYRLFPIRITAGFVIYMQFRRCVFTKCKLQHELGINTGTSCCIVKLPDEVRV